MPTPGPRIGEKRFRVTDLGREKWCYGCRDWWPLDAEFWPRDSLPDGFRNECKACRGGSRDYVAENRRRRDARA